MHGFDDGKATNSQRVDEEDGAEDEQASLLCCVKRSVREGGRAVVRVNECEHLW